MYHRPVMHFASIPAAPVNLLRAIAGLGGRLDQALRRLDELAGSVVTLNDEVRGMRSELTGIADGVDGLRGDVQSMSAGVGGIRQATESLQGTVTVVADGITELDARLGDLAESLVSVDALASRLSRLGSRRSRAGRDAPAGEAEAEAGGIIEGS
jgi:methyl-accepting chemotaxis protein